MNDYNFNAVNFMNVKLLPHARKLTMNEFLKFFIELDYTTIAYCTRD